MRADRLLSLLMLLQVRGRMTAGELADELEVSVRTIYRDMDALSAAGFPVYTEHGPGGGYALVEDYRLGLTGLTEEQVRALFMMGTTAALDELGVGNELRAAMLKLAAALPDSQRDIEAKARHRIHIDTTPWLSQKEASPFLDVLQKAIWQDKKLSIRFLYPVQRGTSVERLVEPYGLVVKGSAWHLVYASQNRMRVVPVDHIVAVVVVVGELFTRDKDFNLIDFWNDWQVRQAGNRLYFRTTVRCSGDAAPWLMRVLAGNVVDRAKVTAGVDGWHELVLGFNTLEEAREKLLGFGGSVEVLEPPALRMSLLDYAERILLLYESGEGTAS